MNEERFERDLRGLLADEAPNTVPATLRASLQSVAAGSQDPHTGPAGALSRSMAAMVTVTSFALVAVLLVGVLLPRLGLAPETGGDGGGRSPGGTPAFSWDSGIVALAVDEAVITAGGQEYLTDPGPFIVRSDPGSETYQTLELDWREHDREMRLYIYLRANDERWWLDELRTRDGREPAEWVTYPGPLLSASLGQPFLGDLARDSTDGHNGFRLEGMRLEAFRPHGTRRDPVTCQPVSTPPSDDETGGPEAGSDPLPGSGLIDMSPSEAAARLADQEQCVSWRFQYRTDELGGGYSEYWCTPPEGDIFDTALDGDGNLVVFVRPVGDLIRPVREQPPLGWGCD